MRIMEGNFKSELKQEAIQKLVLVKREGRGGGEVSTLYVYMVKKLLNVFPLRNLGDVKLCLRITFLREKNKISLKQNLFVLE